MDERRRLVYQDKSSLRDFGIIDPDSLNYLVYNNWLIKRAEIDPFNPKYEEYYLKAFNDAYYICTWALMIPVGKELKPDVTIKFVERPSVVFPLVQLYLSKLKGWSDGIRRFMVFIETKFKIEHDWKHNYNELQEAVAEYDDLLDPSLFAQRELTRDVLAVVNWEVLTNRFEKTIIRNVVMHIARNSEAWRLMCEAIKEAAIQYDYEYGFEEIEQEDYDEDGWYIETVKVEKDPYDSEGNEILDPMKRKGVYEFCDELKEKYEELMIPVQIIKQEREETRVVDTVNDVDMPSELKTEEAQALLKKAQEAGWLDENLQPTVSQTEAAVLAMKLSKKLQIKHVWKVFGAAWNRNKETMRQKYNIAMGQRKSLEFQDRVKEILR